MGSPAIPFGRGPRRALRAWLRETPCGNSGRARGTAIEGAGWLRDWVHCEKDYAQGFTISRLEKVWVAGS